jgi:hypothetical protein
MTDDRAADTAAWPIRQGTPTVAVADADADDTTGRLYYKY